MSAHAETLRKFFAAAEAARDGEFFAQIRQRKGYLTRETVERWGIGKAPNLAQCRAAGLTEAELESAGLMVRGKFSPYLFFRDCAVIPFRDGERIVYLSSRRLVDFDASTGEEIEKGKKVLYPRSPAKDGTGGIPRPLAFNLEPFYGAAPPALLVVEGVLDAIACIDRGQPAVAQLGGTIREDLAAALRSRYPGGAGVYVAPDATPDVTPRKRAELAGAVGPDARVVILPDGKDPDDIPAEAWQGLMDSAPDAFTCWIGLFEGGPDAWPQGQSDAFRKQLAAWIKNDPACRSFLAAGVRESFNLSGDELEEWLAPPAKGKGRSGSNAGERNRRRTDYLSLANEFFKFRNLGQPGSGSHLRYYKGGFWQWRGTHWEEFPETAFRGPLCHFLNRANGNDAGTNAGQICGVLETLKGEACFLEGENWEMPAWVEDGKASRRPRLVSLKNGLLDLGDYIDGGRLHLLPHTTNFFNVNAFSYNFEPSAKCPRFLRFLEEVLPRADVREVMQEWLGYQLIPETTLQACAMYVGDGANGKSVWLAAVTALVGVDNCSFVPLQAFSSERTFALVPLIGKLVNIHADLGYVTPREEGSFKMITGGDSIQIERKNIDSKSFEMFARCHFATNTPPRFQDRTDATWRRLLYIPFEQKIEPKRRVPGMDKHRWWEETGELPGIFNWALEGLRRLMQRGRFQLPKYLEDAKQEYRSELDCCGRFLDDHCRSEADEEVPSRVLYSAYRLWMKDTGHQALSAENFVREVKRHFKKKVWRTDNVSVSDWYKEDKENLSKEQQEELFYLGDPKARKKDRMWKDLKFYPNGAPSKSEQSEPVAAGAEIPPEFQA